MENSLGTPLSDEDMLVQTCVEPGETGHQQPKDYASYLNFITCYMVAMTLLFVVAFRSDMKRTRADHNAEAASVASTKATASSSLKGDDDEEAKLT